MKKILLLLTGLCLIATSALASSGKIAYVDTQKVFETTNLGKKYQATIREYFESRKKLVDEQKQEIQKMQEDYIKQKQGKLISEKALEEKKESIGQEMNELDKRMNEFNTEIEKKRDSLLDDFGQKMTNIIKQIAKKENISMVLSRSISIQSAGTALVIYADDDLNLTNAVIAAMDKNEKKK